MESNRRSDAMPATSLPRESWLRKGVLAGLLATFAMTIALLAAYALARGIGAESGNLLQRWCWALVHNPITERTADRLVLAVGANLAVGLVLALVYARVVEPMLSGPGWRRGVMFSIVPWLLSIIVFLPAAGGGLLGIDIGAGPLPVIGNLLLHLVYGAVLGTVYAQPAYDWLDDTAADHENSAAAERGAAIGTAIGLPVGFVVGWLIAPMFPGLVGQAEAAIGLAFVGAAIGLSVGSFAAMGDRSQPAR